MRIKAAVLFVLAGILLCLSGCTPAAKELTESDIENAKTVFDVVSLMTNSENAMIYSECKDDKDLYFYFDLLNTDEYIKVNHKGQDYLLLWYTYYSYTDKVTDACSVSKSFHGKELKVTVTVDKEDLGEGIEGCFPTQSKVRLILKLENDVNMINVGNRLFSKFNGGRRRIFKKDCVVDENLNFILPPVYDGIMDRAVPGKRMSYALPLLQRPNERRYGQQLQYRIGQQIRQHILHQREQVYSRYRWR